MTVEDAIIDLQITLNPNEATETQRILSDLDHDGDVTTEDATEILQHIVGLKEITDCGPGM